MGKDSEQQTNTGIAGEEPFFNIQVIDRHRLATDGVGVTTLVALYGCTLRCKYCLNKNYLMKPKYTKYTAKQLLEKIIIDYCYFAATGGGVTFGGGESMLYAEAILEFMKIIPDQMKVNLETAMNIDVPDEIFDEVVKRAGELIIDIKSMNAEVYEEYTQRTPDKTLRNLKRIIELGCEDKCRIRIPVIPEYTTQEDVDRDEAIIREMGFNNIDKFEYVLRDYMKEEWTT